VIFAYLSTSIDSAPASVSVSTAVSCLIKHLKTLNKLDQSYPDNDVSLDSVDCETIVKDQLEYEEQEFLEKYEVLIAGIEDCVGKEVKKHAAFDETLLIIVYERSSHLSESDKEKKISESSERRSNIHKRDIRWCRENQIYGRLFDELWEAANETSDESEKNGLEDYCSRKHVVDGGFLDTNIFNVTLNPNNLNTEGIDCNELLKNETTTTKLEFEKELREGFTSLFNKSESDKITECALKKFDELNFSGILRAIAVLGELSPSVEQIQSERRKFIESQRQLADAGFLCSDKLKSVSQALNNQNK